MAKEKELRLCLDKPRFHWAIHAATGLDFYTMKVRLDLQNKGSVSAIVDTKKALFSPLSPLSSLTVQEME